MVKRKSNIVVGSSGLIKSINKKNVLNTIKRSEMISRAEISREVKLTMPTVMRISEELIQDGLVCEVGKGVSTGGRKPNLLSIVPNGRYFLGTVIQKNIQSIVANMSGDILSSYRRDIDYSGGEDKILAQLEQCMEEAVRMSGLTENDISYSGIGTPGMGFKYTEQASDDVFSYWATKRMDFFKEKGHFKWPTVVENVAKLGALGELEYGIGKNLDDYLYIFADYGIGMGRVKGGKLDVGNSGVAGELGHMSIDFNGRDCYCGNRGCLESYCSINALLKEYRREKMMNGSAEGAGYGLQTIEDAAGQGDPVAEEVLKRVGSWLGIGLANVVNIYNPGAIILGGELERRFPLYVQSTSETMMKNIFMDKSRNIKVLAGTIEKPMEALGAVALAIEAYFEKYCSDKTK